MIQGPVQREGCSHEVTGKEVMGRDASTRCVVRSTAAAQACDSSHPDAGRPALAIGGARAPPDGAAFNPQPDPPARWSLAQVSRSGLIGLVPQPAIHTVEDPNL